MKNSTVVICDDAGFVRSILKQTLESLGFVVVAEAVDGFEAEKLVKKYQPEFLFLDLVLPERNGIDTAIAIRQFDRQVQIVAMSTLDDQRIQQKAKDVGCNTWLPKPFQLEQLKNVLKAAPHTEAKIV